jgi:hypothetical protein
LRAGTVCSWEWAMHIYVFHLRWEDHIWSSSYHNLIIQGTEFGPSCTAFLAQTDDIQGSEYFIFGHRLIVMSNTNPFTLFKTQSLFCSCTDALQLVICKPCIDIPMQTDYFSTATMAWRIHLQKNFKPFLIKVNIVY